MTPLRATDVLDEATELFAQSNQNLIFVFDGFCDMERLGFVHRVRWAMNLLTIEEGNELLSSALSAESKSNGRESVDGVEAEEYIVVLR